MPTVADVEILAKTLGSILAGKPQSHGALTVIPMLAPMQAEPEWLTLAEAGDRVRITEVGEEGSVPDLRVADLGDLPLLLLDGEQLVGAKQNRILKHHGPGGGPDLGDHPRELRGAGVVGLPGPPLGAQRFFPVRRPAARSARGAATRQISRASGRPSP